ncbi:MAG: hypothetical protein WC415_04830 [Patescibacteria group bacterium]|jgi:hypothetical protein
MINYPTYILKPLIFLDIFDYPPTAMEVWRFLGVEAELREVMEEASLFCHPERSDSGVKDLVLQKHSEQSNLDQNSFTLEGTDPSSRAYGTQDDKKGDEVEMKNGFYFLSGREVLIEKRREFFYLAERKFKIARKATRILRFIPSIKMMAVCNNFYYRPESDIDFLIITAAKRLWLTRFLATIILDIFNLRARGKKTANRICLSFYLSENNLNLEEVALKPLTVGEETLWNGDPCLACWLAFMEPLYGFEVYEKFWQANNLPKSWFKKIFPNAFLRRSPQIRLVRDNHFSKIIKKIISILFLGSLGNLLEKISEKIQRLKLSARVKELAAQDNTNVVLDERILKFHEEDDRENFREQLRIKKEEFNKC